MKRIFQFATLVACLLCGVSSAVAESWYVGPNGTPDNNGTQQSPWDIESTLQGTRNVKPGDTVFLLGGTYRRRPDEKFVVRLAGQEGKPTHLRPAPGEHVIIDGGLTVQNPAEYLWIWDLEILVSEPDTTKTKPASAGSHPQDFKRPWGGLNVHGGAGCKYINLVIHDCRQGVSFWSGATDSELHGCIIYDNGWTGTDRGHGHAIYTQNKDGVKTISDCIMTGGRSYTMHAYGSSRAYVDNFLIQGNVAYNAGTFLIGGGRPSHNIRVLENYLYNVPLQIGYSAPHNEDCEVRDNLIVNTGMQIKNYRNVMKSGNLLLGRNEPRPSSEKAKIMIRPNRYDLSRAHVIIFNWARQPEVEVRLGSFLKVGDAFRIVDPRAMFGKPLLEDRYRGTTIRLPVKGDFVALVLLKENVERK